MRIGQTSIIVFISKLIGSALGFFATLYFARVLGAEVLGIYAAVTAVASWLALGGSLGVSGGIKKRLSEGGDQGEYLVAGIVMTVFLTAFVFVLLTLGRPFFESYISDFDNYVEITVVVFIGAFVIVKLIHGLVNSTLQGQNLVHIYGILSSIKVGVTSLIQIGLVVAGFSLLGMLLGYVAGMIVISAIGLLFVSMSFEFPRRHHFRRVYDFAKYSWLGGLEKRTFNDIDILVLTALVPSALVGVYSVAWSISKFLVLFGRSIRNSTFPEISRISAQEDEESAAHLIEDGLAFGGLIIFPGLVGGVILSERLLQIYGPEFVQGTPVLGLLILAVLFHSFQKMLMNSLDALDRPDLAFRINIIFVLVNIVLNIILVVSIGWVGAAIATVISAVMGLMLAFRSLRTVVEFQVPRKEIGNQILAALLMGGAVWAALDIIEETALIEHNVAIVLGLVTLGSGIYFAILAGISKRFRTTVWRNLPVVVSARFP